MDHGDELDYYEIFVDGEQARGGTNGFSSLNWPTFRLGFPLEYVSKLSVLEVNFPQSYYVINSTNHTFSLTISAVNYTVTIPVGNYISSNFVTTFATVLNALGTGVTWTVTNATSNLQVPVYLAVADIQHRLVVSNSGPTPFTFTFGQADDNGATNPRLWMGYNAGVNSFTGAAAGGVAPVAPNFFGFNFVYVNSTKLGNVIDAYVTDGKIFTGNMQPIMARAIVNRNLLGVSQYQDPSPDQMWNIGGLYNLQEFDIYLSTPQGTLIDFNGQTFSVKLGILARAASKSSDRTHKQSSFKIQRIK
jgi:hypothetical protein